MATDIAFALGVLSLFGKRVLITLKVFLTALAIADDLLAVAVIAIFYTPELNVGMLGLAFLTIGLMVLANRMGVRATWVYTLLAFVVWIDVLGSGVHATIAGVLVAMVIPVRPAIDPETRPDVCLGIIIGLLPTGTLLGFLALLGAMSLAGMMVKNAIVLLDQVNIEIAEGKNLYAAVLAASVSRLCPVVLAAAIPCLGLYHFCRIYSGLAWRSISCSVSPNHCRLGDMSRKSVRKRYVCDNLSLFLFFLSVLPLLDSLNC